MILLQAAGFAALALALFLLYVVLRYVPIIERNAFEVPRHRPPEAARPPRGLEGEAVRIAAPGGGLEARLVRAKRPSGRTVVFCHETGADAASWFRHAGFAPEEGFDVLTFGYEGPASTQWPSRGELATVRAALRWALARSPDVALFGVSKGAVLAAAAAAEERGARCAVLDGAFSTYRTLEAYMRRWVSIYVTIPGVARRVPGWAYPALGFLAVAYGGLRKGTRFFTAETFVSRLKLPVFFIHAEQDPFVRLEDAERLRARVRGPADLWVAEGAGHSESAKVQAREYRERILAFLRRHFSTAC